MPPFRVRLVATLALLIAAQAAAAQTPPAQKAAPAAPRQPPSTASQPPVPGPSDVVTSEYKVAAGDALHVFVWKEPDLSREVRVRPDGYVTVPLLGDVFAVGKSPKELAAELSQALSQFVTSPLVTITVGASSTLRFYVVGEVNKPGEYPLVGRTTVMQALALAGGFKEYAKTEEIKILRQEAATDAARPRAREVMLPLNYKAIAQGHNLHQNFTLKPGDVIVVP